MWETIINNPWILFSIRAVIFGFFAIGAALGFAIAGAIIVSAFVQFRKMIRGF